MSVLADLLEHSDLLTTKVKDLEAGKVNVNRESLPITVAGTDTDVDDLAPPLSPEVSSSPVSTVVTMDCGPMAVLGFTISNNNSRWWWRRRCPARRVKLLPIYLSSIYEIYLCHMT